MKKAIDQTVRDLKRGVNKKVLKVPLIEQKVLDSTSNEPWGPHGTLLAEIAQASRNSYEYQMIMTIIWKRINDTGKNWRHVYKALIVLEYLVGHGSERVIEEIREHAYQIQTLADFQYIDSSGRDQGNNVRKKSQNLVVLVNDKDRIYEVREKAAANRDKFQSSSAGSMYRPGSRGRYDDRYGSRDEEPNGYGREREHGYRDDDRYGKYGGSYSRDGDRYSSREYADRDRYGQDDSYRRRSPSVDYGSRSRSSDRDRDRGYEDDGQYSSRGSGARADNQSQDQSASGRKLGRNYSEQNLSAPPSYEDAVGSARTSTHSERDGETSAAAPKSSFHSASSSPPQATEAAPKSSYHSARSSPPQATRTAAISPAPSSSVAPAANNKEASGFNEFDPRGTVPTAPTTSSTVVSESFTDNSLALVPTSEVDTSTSSASGAPSQGFNDPFGDGTFKAIPSTDVAQQQSSRSVPSFQNASNSGPEPPQHASQSSAMVMFTGTTSTSTGDRNIDMLADIFPVSGHQHPVSSQPDYPATVNEAVSQSGQLVPSTFSSSGGPQAHQTGYAPPNQSVPQTAFYGGGPTPPRNSFPVQSGHPSSVHGFPVQSGQLVMHPNFSSQFDLPAPQAFYPVHNGQPSSLAGYPNQSVHSNAAPHGNYHMQSGGQNMAPEVSSAPTSQQNAMSLHNGQPSSSAGYPNQSVHPNAAPYGNYNMQSGGRNMAPEVSSAPTSQQNAMSFHVSPQQFQAPQAGSSALMASQSGFPSSASISTVPPAKDKFETKSSVWTDTLSRGLVNLNISGAKSNPLSDIGVDFDALNRKEKRMEKPTATPVISTVHMGKAMGSGSGIGHAGAGGLRPPSNPMMGAGAGMGMGMAGPRPGVSMPGYGGMNQQSMGVGMGMNMGMGANMGTSQRPMGGFPPGSTMQGGYNPMMGTGNYGHNQYGGGYR